MLLMQLPKSHLWFLDPAWSAMQTACDYACMWTWLCTSMPCSQIVTLHAWACDYARTCMWLCAPMLCSQLVTKHACAYMPIFATQSACSLCVHEHVTMHIYALRSARDYACMCMWLCISMLCSQRNYESMAFFMHIYAVHTSGDHAVISWLCMPALVIMQIYSMQSVCKFACMSMWICTFTMSRQLATMHACACDYAHLCYAASL